MAKRGLSPMARRPISRTKSNEKSSMRGFAKSLSRTFSSSSRNKGSTCAQAQDEVNLFLSDMVTRDYCLEKLSEVRQSPEVTKVEIEDFLISQHQASLLPVIKGLVISDKRQWQWIKFVDTVDPDDYCTMWQTRKQAIMKDYEDTIDFKTQYQMLSFEVTIRITKGTSQEVLRNILESIRQDKTVSKLVFEGSLYNFEPANKPLMLQKLVDQQSGELVDEVVISIATGWSDPLSEESQILLYNCLQALEEQQDQEEEDDDDDAPKSPLRRVRSSCGSLRRVPPRRPHQNLRRIVPTDEVSRSTPKRTTSMPLRKRQGSTAKSTTNAARSGVRRTASSSQRISSRGRTPPRSQSFQGRRLAVLQKPAEEATEEDLSNSSREEETNIDEALANYAKELEQQDEPAVEDQKAKQQTTKSAPITTDKAISPPSRKSSPLRRTGSFHDDTSETKSPKATSPRTSSRKASPRKARSFPQSNDKKHTEETPDYNWGSTRDLSPPSKSDEEDQDEVKPDYNWKASSKAQIDAPLASKAA